MGKQRIKPNYRRRVLRLPDLDHCKLAVLNSLGSPASRRVYEYAIDQFIAWYCSEPRLAFNRIVVVRYRMYLESRQSGRQHHQPATRSRAPPRSRSRRLGLAESRTGCGDQPSERGQAARVSLRQLVERRAKFGSAANMLVAISMRAKRDYAMLAMLFGCGFRRSELVGLELDEIQMRQGHWAVVDLIGKGGHIRTVPIPEWVKAALDQWIVAAGVTEGRIFRAVAKTGKVWGKGISQNVVWYVVKSCCERAGLEHIAPHDLRRTCAKLCHTSGGELEQIQFLLGHASVQTTERYLGCKQNLGHPVNDLFDLRTDGRPHENDGESATVKSSDPVEKASRQGVECRHGGSDHDQPVCDSTTAIPTRTNRFGRGQKRPSPAKPSTLPWGGSFTR